MRKTDRGEPRIASQDGATVAPRGIPADARRVDLFVELVQYCVDAKRIADGLDEKFLGYLLAMAIQETRAAMRNEATATESRQAAPKHPRRAAAKTPPPKSPE